jgi:tetratricopeptide (TPR) repeat protein
MAKKFWSGKGSSSLVLILCLFIACGAFMGLKVKIDRISRAKAPGSSIIYIPSGKFLKYATFGYSSVAADLVYLWAIQYFSNTSVPERFNNLEHVFSIITELDPRYIDPYEVGALIAIYDSKDFDTAFKILDKGLEKNPEQWIFPFDAGHYAQLMKKDWHLAQKYYQKVMAIPGAPEIAKRLYANAAFKLADLKTAWESWLEVYQTTKDERVKKFASNHLYQVKAAMDMETIQEAIKEFREKFGRNPSDLNQLVMARFLSAVPKDLDGGDYLYDPQTGEVKPPKSPWKR